MLVPLMLGLAGAAAQPQAAEAASPYREAVMAAAFDLCPAIRTGRISGDNAAELAGRGFMRAPAAEAQLASLDSERGAPLVFFAGAEQAPVIIFAWPQARYCTVTFKGAEAEASMAAARRRMEQDGAYARQSDQGDAVAGFPGARVFRSGTGAEAALVSLYTPAPDDESRSFVITIESAR